eukprot:scaffold2955_cov36-Phaeocystis_antarctica.AAC.3
MDDARHAHRAAVHTAREGGARAHRLSLLGQGRRARQAGSALRAAPSRPRSLGRAAARQPASWGCRVWFWMVLRSLKERPHRSRPNERPRHGE